MNRNSLFTIHGLRFFVATVALDEFPLLYANTGDPVTAQGP